MSDFSASQQPVPNPALKSLAILIGEWSVEISNMSFLPDQSAVEHGRATMEWLEGGAFLVMHSDPGRAGVPGSIGVIGRDDSIETYTMLYFDSRGVSRIYEMSLEDGVWKMWRDAPGFRQRFTGTFSGDGNTINANWEKSSAGAHWEHDFDLTYRRNNRSGNSAQIE
jgi:hypothetical protein